MTTTNEESTAWITVGILALPESTGESVGPKAELALRLMMLVWRRTPRR
jgi:hypothetical protein